MDTSAWVEFLRDTGSATCVAVEESLSGEIATCDAVVMEVLAGARDERHLGQLQGLLARATVISIAPGDYEDAAALHRTCRRAGDSVRKLVDCLVAAVAISAGAEILHADRDFEVLARHTRLVTHPASARVL